MPLALLLFFSVECGERKVEWKVGSDINVISFLMGVTPVDELGLIEQTCSLSSYSGVGEGVGVMGPRVWEMMRCKTE